MVSWVYLFSADSTALLISDVYQFCGGFHQLSLSTLFSFQLAILQVLSPPILIVPMCREGTFSKQEFNPEQRTIPWTDATEATG